MSDGLLIFTSQRISKCTLSSVSMWMAWRGGEVLIETPDAENATGDSRDCSMPTPLH